MITTCGWGCVRVIAHAKNPAGIYKDLFPASVRHVRRTAAPVRPVTWFTPLTGAACDPGTAMIFGQYVCVTAINAFSTEIVSIGQECGKRADEHPRVFRLDGGAASTGTAVVVWRFERDCPFVDAVVFGRAGGASGPLECASAAD
ncbi:hypothetical protein [Dactylosporangium sp. NPDC048998]|uniref:hypothetical protein n=1 Tax=Dactylosporangium sp. NPDC048998 TaxID=3363976 RepID=UPI00371C65D8